MVEWTTLEKKKLFVLIDRIANALEKKREFTIFELKKGERKKDVSVKKKVKVQKNSNEKQKKRK